MQTVRSSRAAITLAAALGLIACDGRAGAPSPAGASPVRPGAALVAPAPRGPFPVGRLWRSWARDGAAPVQAWVYYPADAPVASASAGGAPSAGRLASLSRRFGPDAAAALAALRTHAAADAAPADRRSPVLVFAPGASLGASDYRSLLEDVASRGYVVVALAPEGRGDDPDLRRADYARTARDLGFLVEHAAELGSDAASPLAGRLDPGPVGAFGHSMGGASAVLVMARDPRVGAAIDLDGDFADEAAQAAPAGPVLYVMTRTENEAARSEARRVRVWRDVAARSSAPVAVKFETLRHLNFLDAALLPPGQVPPDRRAGRFGEVDGARGLRAAADLIDGFFAEHLQARPGALAAALQTAPEAVRPADYNLPGPT